MCQNPATAARGASGTRGDRLHGRGEDSHGKDGTRGGASEAEDDRAQGVSASGIGSDDALLRIEACGICGSDYEQYEGAAPQHEDYTQYPVIPGHEPLGVIEEIGAQAQARWGVTEGDRVAVRSGYGCGRCAACARFEPRACRTRGGTYGYTDVSRPPQLWGGYAEHMYLSPLSVVKKMDSRIPAGVAVMFNPLAAGLSWAGTIPATGPGRPRGHPGRGTAGALLRHRRPRRPARARSSSPASAATRTSSPSPASWAPTSPSTWRRRTW
jgi:hypothetical protein